MQNKRLFRKVYSTIGNQSVKTKQSNSQQQVLGTKEFFPDDPRELEKMQSLAKIQVQTLKTPIPCFQETD